MGEKLVEGPRHRAGAVTTPSTPDVYPRLRLPGRRRDGQHVPGLPRLREGSARGAQHRRRRARSTRRCRTSISGWRARSRRSSRRPIRRPRRRPNDPQLPIPNSQTTNPSWEFWSLGPREFSVHRLSSPPPTTISRMFRFRSLVVFCGAAVVFAAVPFPPITTFGQARQATADPCAGCARPAADERQDRHDGRARLHRVRGHDPERPVHRGRSARRPAAQPVHARDQPARPHRRSRPHRQPQPHRAARHPPRATTRRSRGRRRLPKCRRRSRRARRACPPARSSRRWAAGTRRSSPRSGCRRWPSSTPRRSDHPVLVFQAFTGPAATNTRGKAFFDGQGRRGERHRRDRRQRAVARGAQRAARGADLRRSEARHARRDGVLRQRRRHDERGHGRVQPARARPTSRARSKPTRWPAPISSGCTTRSSRCTARAR